MNTAILSSPILLENGTFASSEITVEAAKRWVKKSSPKNFCGHETVKLLGL